MYGFTIRNARCRIFDRSIGFCCNGAFAVNRPVEGRFIVLIDDVSTTGATLAEAAQSLARQGARRVEAWALMKALTHGA